MSRRKVLMMHSASSLGPVVPVTNLLTVELDGADESDGVALLVVGPDKHTYPLHPGENLVVVDKAFVRVSRFKGSNPVTVYANCE